MNEPAMTVKVDGDLVSDWVLGFYPSNLLCAYRVVRACRTGKTVEWEYIDGEGEDADRYSISPPYTWRVLIE
jgi:hypothetical protein